MMIKKITTDGDKGLSNFCHRGAIDLNDSMKVGSYGCINLCKRFFKFHIRGKHPRIICSGCWSKKDQRDYDKKQEEFKKNPFPYLKI